jgi:hypothetical protein
MHAELRVVERDLESAVAGELQGVRLHDEVLRLVVHHMLDDLARVLAPALDQPVELRYCLVPIHGQHCGFSFPRRLGAALVIGFRVGGAEQRPAARPDAADPEFPELSGNIGERRLHENAIAAEALPVRALNADCVPTPARHALSRFDVILLHDLPCLCRSRGLICPLRALHLAMFRRLSGSARAEPP